MSAAREAGVLGAIAEGRTRLGPDALPVGVEIAIQTGTDAERATWARALTAAGARVVDDAADLAIEGPDGGGAALGRIVVCDHLVAERVSAMLRARTLDILLRPVGADAIVDACRHALARLPPRPLRRTRGPTQLPLEGATGAALARTRLPVLIVGETGTGKSRMAKMLHETLLPGAPFVEVNAATLASDLVTSELFGHERGAFTGAHASKLGLAAVADGGTLFLDEIGDLAPDAQVKLLSFLDTGTFRPVGGVREARSQARVVCATNRDLPELVAAGRFRDDLYYRLASIVIPIAPLRESADQIPTLARALAVQAAERAGVRVPLLGEDVLAALAGHPWPGNVRQLRFVVERLVAICDGPAVTLDALVPLLPVTNARVTTSAPPPVRRLVEMERDMVERAMLHTGGNRTRAAELLGITPRGLYNKLRRNGTNFRTGGE